MAEKGKSKEDEVTLQGPDEANRELLAEDIFEKALEARAYGIRTPEASTHHLLLAYCLLRSQRAPQGYPMLLEALRTVSELLMTKKDVTEKRLAELDRRSRTQGELMVRIKADVEDLRWRAEGTQTGETINAAEGWPSHISKDFEAVAERTQDLENADGDKSQVLYCMMELETLLGGIEEKARSTGRKYEGRLSASLRNICGLYDPDEMSEEQARRFAACVRALIEGWGKLDREKVSWIRTKLLDVELTWLPVTKKAQKEIEEAKGAAATANDQ